MADAVVAGHVSLDVCPQLTHPVSLEPGRLEVVGPATFSTGGAVTNTGLALHRLGIDVRLIGKVGSDLFGRSVLDTLDALGLADGLIVDETQSTSYTIVINPPGVDRSFLHCAGANETFAPTDVDYDTLEGVRMFHFGYPPLMPRMYDGDGTGLAEMFSGVRAKGAATCLDMCAIDPESAAGRVDWRAVLATTLPFVDVFAPSIDELLFMLDRPAFERLSDGGVRLVVDGGMLRRLGEQLLAMGASVVAIKLGDQGLYLRASADGARVRAFCERLGVDGGEWIGSEVHSPCFTPRVIAGTTGSGDATIAGLIAAALRGAGPLDAATVATAVGAFSVESPDPTGTIPSLEEVRARIAGGWRRSESTLALVGNRSLAH